VRTETAQNWIDRRNNCIAQGALTNSKRPATFIDGVYPQTAIFGHGPYIQDVDGMTYIDFIGGLGTNLIGYGARQMRGADASEAQSISLPTKTEVLLAEKLQATFHCIERLKFLKTGTEACNAAIRIARAYTGNTYILSEGYHGWGDDFISLQSPAAGVPASRAEEYRIGSIRQGDSLDLYVDDNNLAAVIVEPVVLDHSESRKEWLQQLRAECTRLGALLIFDEVITGFRFPKMSVSNYWGIQPDIICLGKALGAGHPISVVGGRKDIMDNPKYFVSGTFFGETLAMTQALTLLALLREPDFSMSDLWRKGQAWLDRFNTLCPELIRIKGYPTRGAFEGDENFRALFWQEACKAGFLFGPSWFYNFPLAELDSDTHFRTFEEIIWKIKSGAVRLEGKMPVPPKAQMMRK
jgi:glutamate-1-semialdehyde aminotransferase